MASRELATQYDPAAVEVPLYQRWLAAGYFHADEQQVLSGAKKPFSIVLPPPNVTGNLHVGHALDHTLMDILARWHRMSGDEVLWLPGMDHAGIATQTAGRAPARRRRQDQARLRPGPVRAEGLGLEGTNTAARSSAR